jgi:hypothetical protein
MSRSESHGGGVGKTSHAAHLQRFLDSGLCDSQSIWGINLRACHVAKMQPCGVPIVAFVRINPCTTAGTIFAICSGLSRHVGGCSRMEGTRMEIAELLLRSALSDKQVFDSLDTCLAEQLITVAQAAALGERLGVVYE